MVNTPLQLDMTIRYASRFAVVGVLNTAIDFTLFIGLSYFFGVPILLANTIAYLAGTANGFVWNKHWTFSEQKEYGQVIWQFPMFLLLYTVGLGASNITVGSLSLITSPLIAKTIAVAVTFIWNFWSTRRFVYKAF